MSTILSAYSLPSISFSFGYFPYVSNKNHTCPFYFTPSHSSYPFLSVFSSFSYESSSSSSFSPASFSSFSCSSFSISLLISTPLNFSHLLSSPLPPTLLFLFRTLLKDCNLLRIIFFLDTIFFLRLVSHPFLLLTQKQV